MSDEHTPEGLQEALEVSRQHAAAAMHVVKGGEAQPSTFQIDDTQTRSSQRADSFDSLFERAIGPLALLPEHQVTVEFKFNQITAVRSIPDLPADTIMVAEDRTIEQIENQTAYAVFLRQWKLIAAVFNHMLSTKAPLVDIDAVLPDDMDYRPYYGESQMELLSITDSKFKRDRLRDNLRDIIKKMADQSGYLQAHEKAFTLVGEKGAEYTAPTVSVLTPNGSLIANYLFGSSSADIELEEGKSITVNFFPVPMMGDHDYFVLFHAGEQKDVNLQRIYSLGVLARRPSQAVIEGEDPNRKVIAGLSAEFFPINPVVHHFTIDQRL